MNTLSIYNIDPSALQIDGVPSERMLLPRPSEAPRLPGIPLPPQSWDFDMPAGPHSLVYAVPNGKAVMGTVTVPEAAGLLLNLVGGEFVVLREPLRAEMVPASRPPVAAPPTVVPVPVPAPDMSIGHKVFMVAGTVAIAAWAWHFLAGDD